MKKVAFAAFGLILFSHFCTAQNQFGVKAGVNISKVKTDSIAYEGAKAVPTLNLGIFLISPISEQLSIQTEFIFNGTAGKLEYDYITINDDSTSVLTELYEVKYRVNYFSIPILARYNIGGFNVQVGPTVSFNVRALADQKYSYARFFEGRIDSKSASDLRDIQQFYKGLELSFNAGVGYEVSDFLFMARYSLGLTNISRIGGKMTNNVIHVSVGYRLWDGY